MANPDGSPMPELEPPAPPLVSRPRRTIAAHEDTADLNKFDRLIACLVLGSTDDPAELLVTAISKARATLNQIVRKEAGYPGRAELRERLKKLT